MQQNEQYNGTKQNERARKRMRTEKRVNLKDSQESLGCFLEQPSIAMKSLLLKKALPSVRMLLYILRVAFKLQGCSRGWSVSPGGGIPPPLNVDDNQGKLPSNCGK